MDSEKAAFTPKHDPVMVDEILAVLSLQPGDVVMDGTVGLAGHSLRFAQAVAPGGTVLGFDWDIDMLAHAKARLAEVQGVRVELVNEDFRNVSEVVSRLGLRLNGCLLDLGLNSAQVDDPERGISFLKEGPLEMRMDRSRGEPASALLNRLGPVEIERILFEYGDERWARMIAKRIVERRRENPLRTTTDLVDAVLAAIPPKARDKRIHPATRTFQAVRIAVNGELDGLAEGIQDVADALAPGGVLATLSYHSGEDRIVKNVFRELASTDEFEDAIRKPVQAKPSEVANNPRSRSAKLRAIRRKAA
jgi:16S rRNA (cytosine1402-N4)-methyltransferase